MSKASKKTKAGNNVVIYLRYSCARQSDGNSIQYQMDKCSKFVELHDMNVSAVFTDEAKSGKSMRKRDGLHQALSMLGKDGVDTLVCYSISRLTRSMKDLCNIVGDYFGPGGHNLVCVNESIDTSNAAGRLVLHMLGAVMANEVETLGERVQASVDSRKERGLKVSRHAPFGYRKSNRTGKLVADVKERRVHALVVESRNSGMRLSEIMDALKAKRVRNRNGKPYSVVALSKMASMEPIWAA